MHGENIKVTCPNCKILISDSKTTRCPRCNTLLIQPGCKGNCSQCLIKEKCS